MTANFQTMSASISMMTKNSIQSLSTVAKVNPFLNAYNRKRYASTTKRLYFPLCEAKDPSKVIRLDVSKYKGKIYLNLRKWFYKNADINSELIPSRTGITLNEEDWAMLRLQVGLCVYVYATIFI